MRKLFFRFDVISGGLNKRIHFTTLFTILFYFVGHSQINYDSNFIRSEVFQSLDQAEISKLRDYNFNDNFAVLLRADKSSNYFFVDISKLNSPFAFKYFLYLAVQSGNRIQTGHGLNNDRAWFITDNKTPESVALKEIKSFKQRANDKNLILSEKEKEDWIKQNNY